MNSSFIIYTRTSSLTTFMRDSVKRQVLSCKAHIKEHTQSSAEPVDANLIVFSDRCGSETPLHTRPSFNAAVEEALKYDIGDRIIYVENATRIGRELPIVQEAYEVAQKHNVVFCTTKPLQQFLLPGIVGEHLRETWSNTVTLEKQQLRAELMRTKKLRQAQNKLQNKITFSGEGKFDGRPSLMDRHPEVIPLIRDNLNLSLTKLTELIYRKGITSDGKAYGRSTVYRNRKFIVRLLNGGPAAAESTKIA